MLWHDRIDSGHLLRRLHVEQRLELLGHGLLSVELLVGLADVCLELKDSFDQEVFLGHFAVVHKTLGCCASRTLFHFSLF